jgi:hypothetical protein
MATLTTTHRPSGADARPAHSGRPWARIVALTIALTVVLAVLLSAFAWPATHTRPRGVPVAVAGPPPAVEQVAAAVGRAQPGAFDLRPVADAEQARHLVEQRSVYGALILSPTGPRLVVATQAGPAVAQALEQLAQAASGPSAVAVDDVSAAPSGDPHGVGLAAGTLPLALAGALAAAVLTLLVGGFARPATGALLFAVLGGLTGAAILHTWLGALTGNWLAEAGVIALGLAATSLGVLGVAAVAGRPGLALGVLTVVALGNPLSAATSAPVMLPAGWAGFGQALPPGAVVAALRAVSGFGGRGAAGPLTVLAVWGAAGLALLALGGLRRRPARALA